MREILFRGRRNDIGTWVHGDYTQWAFTGVPCICDEYSFAEIDPKTLGQFTGLKDKNGKKIFEGDIIQFHKFRDEPDWVGEVKYEYCSYIAVGRMPLAYEKKIGEEPYFCPFEVEISGIDKTTIKVIGNIHDNPELLKGGTEDG